MRTPRPRPNKLHDELDALLDGRPVELTDELAPLAEAADALRVELATFQLDPEVADRHLERVLERPGTVVQMPVRNHRNGWDLRRRVVAVALAAALVLAPATMASAAALPGQAMYPFKRAIEELRIASVQWSPAREAAERTRIVDVRRGELEQLVKLEMFNQVKPAVNALTVAVLAAQKAVAEASEKGVDQSEVAALTGRLESVESEVDLTFAAVASALRDAPLAAVSVDIRTAVLAAVQESQAKLAPAEVGSTPTPKPKAPENPSDPTGPTGGEPDPTQASTPTESSQTSESTQTTDTTSTTTTTQPEVTTTTSGPEATSGSVESGGGQPAPEDKKQKQKDKKQEDEGLDESAPPTTVPGP